MHKKFSWKKFGKRILYAFLGFVGLIIIGMVYLYIVAIDYPPEPKDLSSLDLKREQPSKGFYTINNSLVP
jgi:isopenicillin-N N-acyltransferase-like protein